MVKKNSIKYFIGIDIGGTRIKAVLRSSENEIIGQKIVFTKNDLSSEKIVKNILKICNFLLKSCEISNSQLCGIGVGVPGTFEKSGKIINLPNLPALIGINFSNIFKNEFGKSVKVKIVNDAQLVYHFHKSELKEKNVAYLTLGTSLGCSLVFNGKLYVGAGLASQLAGSYFISKNKSMRAGYVLAIEYIIKSCNKKGLKITEFSEFKKELKNGNLICLKVFKDYGSNLGYIFRNIFQILHLDKIYLSGGLSNYSKYFLDESLNVFDKMGGTMGVCPVEILKNNSKFEMGAIGASKLFEK